MTGKIIGGIVTAILVTAGGVYYAADRNDLFSPASSSSPGSCGGCCSARKRASTAVPPVAIGTTNETIKVSTESKVQVHRETLAAGVGGLAASTANSAKDAHCCPE